MHIIVCIKAIPKADSLQFDPRTNNIVRSSVELVLNKPDRHAIEEALRLRKASLRADGRISVLTMGPEQATSVLREAFALGCDDGYLLSDRAFAGADTLATARVVAKAVEKMEPYDLIICGSHSLDADTGQVPVQLAELLGVPHVTSVVRVTMTDDGLTVIRSLECGTQKVTSPLPAVIAVTEAINEPRYAHAIGIMKSMKKPVTTWTSVDLGLSASETGAQGSPTQVSRLFSADSKRETTVHSGTIAEQTAALLRDLKMRGAL